MPMTIEKNNLCPACMKQGTLVKNITVKHLVIEELMEQVGTEDYYLCMNEECDMAYYQSESKRTFTTPQLNVPLWFKKEANPKYACYCSKVTEEQVMNAVLQGNAKSMKEVLKITGAMRNSACQKNNPLGKCCHQIIQEAMDKAMSIKQPESIALNSLE